MVSDDFLQTFILLISGLLVFISIFSVSAGQPVLFANFSNFKS